MNSCTIYYGICKGCQSSLSSGDQEALLDDSEEFFCTPSQTNLHDDDGELYHETCTS